MEVEGSERGCWGGGCVLVQRTGGSACFLDMWQDFGEVLSEDPTLGGCIGIARQKTLIFQKRERGGVLNCPVNLRKGLNGVMVGSE